MREDSDDPLYLIGDHLGSTSLVLDTAGLEVAKQSYFPFGEDWGVSAADLPTDFTFTGQREAAEIGLKYYGARWYDSEIGHFIQADTVVPESQGVQAWNRYAYVTYNPVKYIDPSGHIIFRPPSNNQIMTDGGNNYYMDQGKNVTVNIPTEVKTYMTPTPPSYTPLPTPKPPEILQQPTFSPEPVPTPQLTPSPNYLFEEKQSDVALSLSLDVNGGGLGIGGVGSSGVVFKNGIHPYIEYGESNAWPGGVSLGITFGVDWGVQNLSDFEGLDS